MLKSSTRSQTTMPFRNQSAICSPFVVHRLEQPVLRISAINVATLGQALPC